MSRAQNKSYQPENVVVGIKNTLQNYSFYFCFRQQLIRQLYMLNKYFQKRIKSAMQSFLLATLLFTTTLSAQITNDDRVMLQGFYWESAANNPNNWYNIVNMSSQEISDMGIDMIWLRPPSNAGSLEGYLPRELNNFANNYGSLQAHTDMLDALNSKGIEPVADIVINHRVGNTNFLDFVNPAWGTDSVTSNDEVWSQPEYSNTFPRGNNDTGTSYEAARDIDHTKPYVQNSIIEFLNNLKTLGYKGWRYDFVHGFDTSYFTLYNNATNPTYSVGENFNSDKQVVQDWIDATSSNAFDFPSYFTIKSAIRDNNYSYLSNNGEASGGIGWDPKNYTTFVENHDTPRYDPQNNVLNAGNVGQTYAYLLTHPGVPCIYWPHLFDWGDAVKGEISDLIAIRKEAGIHSQSSLTIQTAQNGVYAAIISGENFNVAMKMGPSDWTPNGANWALVTSGNNYAVWTSENTTTDNGEFTVFVENYTHVYTWTTAGGESNGPWPGTELSEIVDGYRSATITGTCSNVIFSNNGDNQTSNLSTCEDKPYYYDGTWHENPRTLSNPDVLSENKPFLFPNPIKKTAHINLKILETSEHVLAEIVHINGKSQTIFIGKLNNGVQTISIDRSELQLQTGIYFLRISANKKTTVQKIIVK